jgi:hypothetical protein
MRENKAEIKHLSVRIEPDLLKKFRFACKYEDRSANGQILNFIRKFVEDFEQSHGEIDTSEISED